MNKQQTNQESAQNSGFTIIEVVLVLAIAGLIFLMVFIALPALQRGQRDTQRKQDLSRITVQMTNYLSSSRGEILKDDGDLKDFVDNYLRRSTDDTTGLEATQAGDDYKDPTGDEDREKPNYVLKLRQVPQVLGDIGYYNGHLCSATEATGVTNSGPRNYALTIKLESQNVPYCVDSRSQ